MTYDELLAIYNKRVKIQTYTLPTNIFDLVVQFNIQIKNSLQAKSDWGDNSPLNQCNACLSIVDGEYTIYYDEKYPYKNFAVAHEIAHYLLGHTTDGIGYHHDANLLGAIIVAPPHLVKQAKIKTAEELSLKCKIPIEVAEEYQDEYKNCMNSSRFFKRITLFSLITVTCICGVLTFARLGKVASSKDYTIGTKNKNTETTTLSTTFETTTDTTPSVGSNVYVTKYGKKFHKPTCRYIKKSKNIISISYNKAIENGYEPCQICFDN